MKCYPKMLLAALLAMAAVLFAGSITNLAVAIAATEAEAEETPYTEEEHNEYEAATKETDLAKRGTMLLDFIKKYPKSALMPHINFAYDAMLNECKALKNYKLLETQAEEWLKLHPEDLRTLAFVAEATNQNQNYQRCVECYEEIYEKQPSAALAKEIYLLYEKTKNLKMQLEWADKMFQMPEFAEDYGLRYTFAAKYLESKNMPKAAEYAQLTLKALDALKQPAADKQDEIREVRRGSYAIIGSNLLSQDKFEEAIPYFKKAISAKPYGDDYYNVALCLHKIKDVEEANIYYAAAELMGGEGAAKAKAALEDLYKALHNGNTVGIEKVYRKAKEMMSGTEKAQ